MAKVIKTLGMLFGLMVVTASQAALQIEITQGISGGSPIAIAPFLGSAPGDPVDQIVSADLARSGRFNVLPTDKMPARPKSMGEVDYGVWRQTGSDNLVVGQITSTAGGYNIQFQILDIYSGKSIGGYQVQAKAGSLRSAAHQVSDLIYEKLLGKRGAFDTRIAYVSVPAVTTYPARRQYQLIVADADGASAQIVLTSPEPIMSPAWSPDGTRLAYVSFEGKRPRIVIQDLVSGTRRPISNQAGINGAPAWSPDGRYIAAALTATGGTDTDIYLIDAQSGQTRRLTNTPGIDTEPDYSPDGSKLVFTSDRGGSPQVYQMEVAGGSIERLSYEGGYNARPRYSADGKSIILVQGSKRGYVIAALELGNRGTQILTEGSLDESPSFAPNGDIIMYASRFRGRGVLSTVSFDGKVKQRLAGEGDVRSAAWSPYRKR